MKKLKIKTEKGDYNSQWRRIMNILKAGCLFILVLLFSYFFTFHSSLLTPHCFAEEAVGAKKEVEKGEKEVKKEREPFEVSPEFKRKRRVEMPEIIVRGVMESKDKRVAIAEIDLEYEKGVSLLEVGDRVSIERRGGADSERGSTYFTVKSVSRAGICIELENGEKVWYSVMGEE